MALLDLLGRRWALRILWEIRETTLSFRALQSACDDISPSVLSRRLGELRAAGIVEHQPAEGYRLSAEGERLLQMLLPLTRWAEDWSRRQRG